MTIPTFILGLCVGAFLMDFFYGEKSYREGKREGERSARAKIRREMALRAEGDYPEVNTELCSRMIGKQVHRAHMVMKALVRMPADVSRN